MAGTKTKTKKPTPKRHADSNGAPVSAEVLTLAEAAAFLRVAEAALVDAIGSQGLPGKQIGGEWRFLKSSLQDWLKSPPHTGNQAFLALAGTWKDDPYVDEMLENIYKQRGRPMIGEKE